MCQANAHAKKRKLKKTISFKVFSPFTLLFILIDNFQRLYITMFLTCDAALQSKAGPQGIHYIKIR